MSMNLGVSPLLQYGLDETRKRVLEAVLQAISVIDYVPFDSTTIGNPALDVGDILTFSGGHADEQSRTCITGYTYKINGKHTIKCVGKNPRLADAKSKNDKNITGLLNQVEAGKIIYYNFINAAPFLIKTTPQEVLSIEYVAAEETSATFLAEILLKANPEKGTQQVVATDSEGKEMTLNLPTDGAVMLVGVANILDVQVIGSGCVLRTAVIFFYISNEGVSLVENAGHLGLPIPAKLKDVLEQLHDRAEKEDEKNE